jgi:YbgC/YbaW family acyl-CoA thioester hydrolase
MINDYTSFNDNFNFKIEFVVPWGDLDVSGYVNNSNYLRYFEFVRMAYFSSIDFMNYKDGLGPIMKRMKNITFIKPLKYPDYLKIGLKLIGVSECKTTIYLEHCIFSKNYQEVTTIGTAEICCYDYKNCKKINYPESLLNKIRSDLSS